jgi:Flp pilus assembly protein TadD
MKRQLMVWIGIGALASSACGGGGKPAETQHASSSSSAPTTNKASQTSPAATGPKIEGPAAPTNSDDVRVGIAALKAGDINGARASFEVAIQKNPKQADAHYYLGLVLDQTGDKAGAEKEFREALSVQPDLEEAQINLAAVLVEGGKADEAATIMKKAIAKNPKNPALHINLGMALSGKGDVEGANKEFEEASRLEPNNATHLVTYAAHLTRSNRRDQAIAKLKQAEKVGLTDAGALAGVALEYKNMKEYKSCIAVLDKAVQVKDLAELRIYRGTCKLGLKDLQGATTEFRDAVQREPNNALAHYSLGNALADGGKLDEAIKEWETYLKLAPNGPQAGAADRKIKIAKEKTGGGKK